MSQDPFARKKQCKACPWKKSTIPQDDIPGGYSEELHEGLCHLKDDAGPFQTGKIMGCHESKPGSEYACVGWLAHELGPGNNIGLRLRCMNTGKLELDGEQHGSIEETLP